MTYLKPTLAPVDATVDRALCCRIVITTGDNDRTIGPLICPFPGGMDACLISGPDLPTVCVYSS